MLIFRDKYLAIGESDRMTLLFKKPIEDDKDFLNAFTKVLYKMIFLKHLESSLNYDDKLYLGIYER